MSKSKKKSNKNIYSKEKKTIKILKKNIFINILVFSIGLALFCLLMIRDYLGEGGVIETALYYMVYAVRILFGNASFMFSIILMVLGFFGIKNKVKTNRINRKIAGFIAFSSYALILTLEELGPIGDNFSDASSDILRQAFEFKGGGLLGAILSIPLYSVIKETWVFLIVLLICLISTILALSKLLRLIYLTINKTIEYYNSEEYEKKKQLIEAKKLYELNKQKELEEEKEKKFSEFFIKLKDNQLEKEIYKKNNTDKNSQEPDFYNEEELNDKKKLWLDYYNRIEELKKYENEKKEKELEEKRLKKIEEDNAKYFEKKYETIEETPDTYVNEEFDISDFTSEEFLENKNTSFETMNSISSYSEYIEKKEIVEQNDEIIDEVRENIIEYDEIIEQEKSEIQENNYIEMSNINREELNKSIEELFKYRSMDDNKKEEMKREITKNISLLEDTLKAFGVDATVTDYATGPTITRYEIKIPNNVKVKKVTELESELKMYLKAESIRIEAPIPGKDAIGIETPNKIKEPVYFSNLIHSDKLEEGILPVILGKDIVGKERIVDITKLPHLLIAGTTGSGKSIAINTMIASLISKKTDEEVKFIMVDPKMVELMPYNGIAHLLTPVITDPNMASIALKWAVNEMEERYKKLASLGLRNIESYNKKFYRDKMPYIVIIIDELADLMMVASDNVETSIARIAQKARAIGIHLIVATQRPSADVITGMIKANLPSRISCALRSFIDSRTILDQPGAEKLLGKGDMLFLDNGRAKLERLQGAYISDEEVTELTNLIKKNKKVIYNDSILEDVEESTDESRDPLFNAAVEIAKKQVDKLSISLLQRELKVGFNRAARICQQLKDFGVIDEDNRYTESEIY